MGCELLPERGGPWGTILFTPGAGREPALNPPPAGLRRLGRPVPNERLPSRPRPLHPRGRPSSGGPAARLRLEPLLRLQHRLSAARTPPRHPPLGGPAAPSVTAAELWGGVGRRVGGRAPPEDAPTRRGRPASRRHRGAARASGTEGAPASTNDRNAPRPLASPRPPFPDAWTPRRNTQAAAPWPKLRETGEVFVHFRRPPSVPPPRFHSRDLQSPGPRGSASPPGLRRRPPRRLLGGSGLTPRAAPGGG